MAQASENAAELSAMQRQLTELNRQLVGNCEVLTGDGSLKQALGGIERQLSRNSEVLESLGRQVGSVPAAARSKRWWPFSK